MTITRRGFLTGMLGIVSVPAVVKTGSSMDNTTNSQPGSMTDERYFSEHVIPEHADIFKNASCNPHKVTAGQACNAVQPLSPFVSDLPLVSYVSNDPVDLRYVY